MYHQKPFYKLGMIAFTALYVAWVCLTCTAGEQAELKVSKRLVTIIKEEGCIRDFSWSPDAKTVSYNVFLLTNWGCEQEIMLVDLTGVGSEGKNKVRRLNFETSLECGSHMTWGYDSKSVVLRNGYGILSKSYLIGLESLEKSEIVVPENWVIFDEECSPIANLIVCNAAKIDTSSWAELGSEHRIGNLEFFRPWRIALVDLDSNSFRLIPEDSTEGEPFSPSWSPDGKRITYCAAEDGYDNPVCSCFGLSLTTRDKIKMFDKEEEYEFSGVSRDGMIQILAQYDQTSKHYLGAWALKTDGSGEMWRLTDSLPGELPTKSYSEVFSPDLRFVADLYIQEGKHYLRIRDLESGRRKLLDAYLQPNGVFPLAWSPDGRKLCYLRQDPKIQVKELMMVEIEE